MEVASRKELNFILLAPIYLKMFEERFKMLMGSEKAKVERNEKETNEARSAVGFVRIYLEITPRTM